MPGYCGDCGFGPEPCERRHEAGAGPGLVQALGEFVECREWAEEELPPYGIMPLRGDLMAFRGEVGVVVASSPEEVQVAFPDGQAVHYWLEERELTWVARPARTRVIVAA